MGLDPNIEKTHLEHDFPLREHVPQRFEAAEQNRAAAAVENLFKELQSPEGEKRSIQEWQIFLNESCSQMEEKSIQMRGSGIRIALYPKL